MSADSQIELLLRLIDDPDETVYRAVMEGLVAMGDQARTRCGTELERSTDPLVKQRLSEILWTIRLRPLQQLVLLIRSHAASQRDVNLEDAVVLLDQFSEPGSTPQSVREYLDGLALQIHEEFIRMVPAAELTHLMSVHSILYEQEGFHGAFQDYYDPRNNCLASVIERKEGSPIALSVIELLVADRVGLDLQAIGLPSHFILYSPELDVFIDPFHHGRFLSLPDLEPSSDILQPRTNIYIIMRMMRNLVNAFERRSMLRESSALREAIIELEHSSRIDRS